MPARRLSLTLLPTHDIRLPLTLGSRDPACRTATGDRPRRRPQFTLEWRHRHLERPSQLDHPHRSRHLPQQRGRHLRCHPQQRWIHHPGPKHHRQKLALSNGLLTGDFNITTEELFTWTGGNMTGSGVTQANGGMQLGVPNDNFNNYSMYLDGRTLNNAAGQTAAFSGDRSYFYVSNGAQINNAGTFLAQNNTFIGYGGGSPSIFNNTGSSPATMARVRSPWASPLTTRVSLTCRPVN